jgi:hypothetical protein
VTDSQGTVIARAASASQPSAFATWLNEQADAYERTHPTTKVPLIRAKVVGTGEGADRTVTCSVLDDAREEGRPVLLYVGRTEKVGDPKKARSVAAASRKFEKSTLGSKKAAEAAGDFVLLRLDVGDPDHALLAKNLGVKKIPTVLLWAPKAKEPTDLGGRISGASLANKMKKTPKLPADEIGADTDEE